jgi:hypothetical protein
MEDMRQYNDRGYDPGADFIATEQRLNENQWELEKCNRFREINSHTLPEMCAKCKIICPTIGKPQKGICLPVE